MYHRLTDLYTRNKYYIDIVLSVALALASLLHYMEVLGGFDEDILIFFTTLGTFPVFVSALFSIKERDWASMDMLASIALLFSIISGEWSSAVFISLMLSSARILEDITEKRTKKNLNSLLKLRPEKAKKEVDGNLTEIRLEEIAVGDIVVIDVGEYVPIDGIIVHGEAAINESSLTGESVPVEKTIGDKVSSGTLVVSGSIKVKTLLIGKDTTLEKIIALIEQAEDEKPQTQTLGEKFGKFYLSFVFISSFVLLVITHNVLLVLSVVLVVCADDIAIAIPLGYLKAIGSAAKHGVVVKGGKHLEALGKVDVIVFDKTGTLTQGKLNISSVVVTNKIQEDEFVRLGSIVARRSTHPLSKAIVDFGEKKGNKEVFPDESEVVEGMGVIAKIGDASVVLGRERLMKDKGIIFQEELKKQSEVYEKKGASISYLANNNEVVGFFAAEDTIKKDTKKAIKELYALGIKKIIMLSGDNELVAQSVAKQVGIKDFRANLLPEDKLHILQELNKKHHVAMVGDGVNDAAALSISSVGIAMGALGSDSAIESAEIVLMHDNLSAIPRTVRLARQVHTISVEDFGIWVVTNGIGLALVFGGFIGPSGAAAYNFISDFFPLINAMRVKMK